MLKALFMFSDRSDLGMQKVDVIEYQGHLWIVPEWNDMPELKLTRPVRIIRLDGLQYSDLRGNPNRTADFVLRDSIPTMLWEGKFPAPPGAIIENPPIELPIPGAAH